MRCQQCDYPLWGLTTRACPECARPFQPSDFDFAPNSVQFCCPHCRQTYYGTDARGHLTPVTFDCVTCHQRLHMDEMTLLPASGLSEDQTSQQTLPWLEREKIGRVKAWFKTLGMGLVQPGRVMALTLPHQRTGSAFWFMFVTMTLTFVMGLILPIGFMFWMMASMGTPGAGIGGAMIATILVPIVFAFVAFGVWFLSVHGILAITGGTEHGGGRTIQALSYSAAANVFTAVPCIGMYLSPIAVIWWCVSATRMLVHGQRVHWARATVATSFLPVVLLALWIGFMVYAVRSARNTTATITPGTTVYAMPLSNGEQSAERVYRALRKYADAHDGVGPVHALRLISSGILRPDEIVVQESALNPGLIRIGQMDLNEIASLPERQRDQLAASTEEEMPPALIAHRFGDYVFCYHGISLKAPPKDLWLFVLAPRKLSYGYGQQTWAPAEIYAVGTLGEVIEIPRDAIESKLADQNRLRRRYHLPPLPSLDSITADTPATTSAPASAPE